MKEHFKRYYPHYATVGLIIVVCLGVRFTPSVVHLLAGSNPSDRGQYGDMFGVLTSLFTGLAFAGLIGTLLLQNQAVTLQREDLRATLAELALSREEMAKSREQLSKQSETLAKQNFETTFFSMLQLRRDIVENMKWNNDFGQEVLGNTVLLHLWMSYHDNRKKGRPATEGSREAIDKYFRNFFKKTKPNWDHILGHCIRYLV